MRRYLARPRRLPEGGATLRPHPELVAEAERVAEHTLMCDEPEVITEAVAYAVSAYHQAVRHVVTVAEARVMRASLPLEARLRDAQRRGRQGKRRDLRGEVAAAERLVERARLSGRAADHERAAERLERLEDALDRLPDLERLMLAAGL